MIKLIFNIYYEILENLKSLFITPKSGINLTKKRIENTYKLIKNNIKIKKNSNILLIGEGNNYYLSYLLSLNNNLVISVDKCRDKKVNIGIRNGKIIKLICNYPNDILKYSNVYLKFDYVISTAVLEHINNPKKIIKIIDNLLNKNGIFFHTIDLSLHNLFNNDIRVKKIPKWFWYLITCNSCKPNNYSKIDYLTIYEKYNYNLKVFNTKLGINIVGIKLT